LSSLGYKEILIVSLPLLLAQSGQFIMAWTDKLMLGGIMTPSDVGVYDVAFKLSMFVNIALTSVNSISSPKFAEAYALKDYIKLEKIVHQSTKLIFWSSIPLLLIFFMFSTTLLEFFGTEFIIGLNAFLLLCSARLVSVFTGPAGNLLQMTGKQMIFMKVLFFAALLNVVLNYFLIPKFGIGGAALASFSSIIFWNLSMVYFVKKHFGFTTIYNPFKS
jgi:O-antigen/teichoic acid export membrane protein